MTVMLDRTAERLSKRAKAVLGFFTAVVAVVAALVTYLVSANARYARAEEFKPVKEKVERHETLIEEMHQDLHWTRDQLWELTRDLGGKPLPLPKH